MVEGLDETALKWITSATLQAHRWRFGRASTLGERANLPRLVEAGDAWCEPVERAMQHFVRVLGQRQRWPGNAAISQPQGTPVQQTLF